MHFPLDDILLLNMVKVKQIYLIYFNLQLSLHKFLLLGTEHALHSMTITILTLPVSCL